MATVGVGRDGAYRMTVDERYKKMTGVRREAKFFAILGGFYGFIKVGLSSIPQLVYGEQLDPAYMAGVGAIIINFLLFTLASGGGRPHKEITVLMWIYAAVTGMVGSKAVLDAWNNPYARSLLSMPSAGKADPYDKALAKLIVQKLSVDPSAAVLDVDIMNLMLNAAGALVLLASAAATVKYMQLKRQPTKVTVSKKGS